MTSRAGTVLSDEHIMKHCSIYKPIPMGMTKSILHQNLNLHTQSPYTVKKLKYHNAVSRPATFDTLAKTLTRITKDDSMRENLKSMYIKEINAPRSIHVSVPPPSVHTPPQMTGPASIVPRSTLALPQPLPDSDVSDFDSEEDEQPFSPNDITASGYRRGQIDGAQMYAIREESSPGYNTPEYNRPYLGDYAGPGPVMMPFVQGTGEILGDNPGRENVTVDDRYIVRQSV